eukprot:CAMPEP_0196769448 /NCGR_PEP_ID=MMETSP1104-20130614/552_1 /TAXON_ID=33652 /ORGANISM="Cafeteria sp., Strain Caron Lab Isolate" /LENGTH=83 /DNA_ID=CAMNT_0042139543 /DNA_START=1 /DNA_END=252 /DNA_ORIENTATION=-
MEAKTPDLERRSAACIARSLQVSQAMRDERERLLHKQAAGRARLGPGADKLFEQWQREHQDVVATLAETSSETKDAEVEAETV